MVAGTFTHNFNVAKVNLNNAHKNVYKTFDKLQLMTTCNIHSVAIWRFLCLMGCVVEVGKCTAAFFFLWRIGRVYQRGSCYAIHLGLDLSGLFQKTAKLGDGYNDRNTNERPFSFTEKETFSGVNILTASEVCMNTVFC